MKNLLGSILLFTAGFEVHAAKVCTVTASETTVQEIVVPTGAALTVGLPRAFVSGVTGNTEDFGVSPLEKNPNHFVLMVKNSAAQATSLTIFDEKGPLNFWLKPTSKNAGCVYLKVNRGF